MRRLSVLVCTTVALGVLPAAAGCSSDDDKGTPTYNIAPRTVRLNETALKGTPTKLGNLSVAAIGLKADIPSVIGSHGELMAKGKFVRVRVEIANTGRDWHDFDLTKQTLVTTDGQTHKLSVDGQMVRRQPFPKVSIGSGGRIETDLFFDIPEKATPKSLRLVGDTAEDTVPAGVVPSVTPTPPSAEVQLN